jgi:hypothetical protein
MPKLHSQGSVESITSLEQQTDQSITDHILDNIPSNLTEESQIELAELDAALSLANLSETIDRTSPPRIMDPPPTCQSARNLPLNASAMNEAMMAKKATRTTRPTTSNGTAKAASGKPGSTGKAKPTKPATTKATISRKSNLPERWLSLPVPKIVTHSKKPPRITLATLDVCAKAKALVKCTQVYGESGKRAKTGKCWDYHKMLSVKKGKEAELKALDPSAVEAMEKYSPCIVCKVCFEN